jgi:plasmid stabilization system protein ParE
MGKGGARADSKTAFELQPPKNNFRGSSNYARTVVKRIVKLTRQLERFPNSGWEVPEFQDQSIRELLAYSYCIIYKVEKEEVIILSVIHGK